MAIITDIVEQKKDKTRRSIYLDGSYYCGLQLETVVLHRLKVGDFVDPDELQNMQLESEKRDALDKSLRFIAARMKSEKEIADYLRKKGYLDDVVGYVLERLRSYGYVDDFAFSKSYAESRSKTKGKRLVAMELKQKGVGEEAIGELLSEYGDETENAVQIAQKYLRGKVVDAASLYKTLRYLLSKGYEYETAKSAVERIKGDGNEEFYDVD